MHCFVINLPRSTERLKKIIKNLNEVNLDFTIVCAISPEDLSKLKYNYNSEKNLRYYHKPLTSGEICCILSHSKAISDFLQSDHEYAVILEDDAETTKLKVSQLSKLERSLNFFDLIKLSDGASKKKVISPVERVEDLEIGFPNKVPNSNMAYLINREGAKKVLKAYEEIYLPADVTLQRWWKYDLRIGFCSSPLFFQNGMDSEINISSNRKKVKRSRSKKIINRIGFELKNKYYSLIKR